MARRIYSRRQTCWFLRNLVQLQGSTFPSSTLVSLPPAIASAFIFILLDHRDDMTEDIILTNNAVWSGFSFLLGFLVVFRTSHAYNRFWEACASVHKMGAEWFDSCSGLMAFTRVSKADRADIVGFQNKAIRLFSVLHAVALAELEDLDNGTEENRVHCFELELVDAGSFDHETLMTLRDSSCRVELVYQWIQSLIVEAADKQVLGIPPPILTRAFQELSSGMVSFHDALKVADTPFPFPYAQTCDALLFVMYIVTPFVVAAYVSTWWLAAFFCFVYVFTFACLTLTGLELEFPYGQDANDIKASEMQLEMNHKLRMLVSRVCWRMPALSEQAAGEQGDALRRITDSSPSYRTCFSILWSELPDISCVGSGSPTRTGSMRRFGPSQENLISYVGAKRQQTLQSGDEKLSKDTNASPENGVAEEFLESKELNGGDPMSEASGSVPSSDHRRKAQKKSTMSGLRKPRRINETGCHKESYLERLAQDAAASTSASKELSDAGTPEGVWYPPRPPQAGNEGKDSEGVRSLDADESQIPADPRPVLYTKYDQRRLSHISEV